MAGPNVTIWLDDALPIAAEAATAAETAAPGPHRLEITFLDEARQPLAPPVEIDAPSPKWLERPAGGGAMAWSRDVPPLTLPRRGGRRAAFVRAAGPGFEREFALAETTSGAPRPPAARFAFGSEAGWTVAAVSEMFEDAASFEHRCRELYDFIVGRAPFNEPAVRSRFRLEGLFWPSGPAGLFGTRPRETRLIFGDNALVRRFLRKAGVRPDMALVLINIPVRGGAGGTRKDPAWASVTANPFERWEAVALHELGHSFGLGDEYVAEAPADVPAKLERNLTKKRGAHEAPWKALRTPGLAHDPTAKAGDTTAFPLDVVGTFEGARYVAEGIYRPSFDCMMRTTSQPFCKVCQALIRKVVVGAR